MDIKSKPSLEQSTDKLRADIRAAVHEFYQNTGTCEILIETWPKQMPLRSADAIGVKIKATL